MTVTSKSNDKDQRKKDASFIKEMVNDQEQSNSQLQRNTLQIMSEKASNILSNENNKK